MDYLFQCAIGPVQEFIATARRSRDLWYGSWLLSELSKAAARAIAESGGQLVFPFSADITRDLATKSKFNSPNKIAAVISESPDAVAANVDQAVYQRLHELRENAFRGLQGLSIFDEALAEAQVNDLIELYWVGVPFDDERGYAEARQKAEAMLNARKATRDFSSIKGDYKPKSSLDGARESVISEIAYLTSSNKAAEKNRKSAVLYNRFRARPSERLSGVDVLKRLGERSDQPVFYSTSYVAALPFLNHIDANQRAGDRKQLFAKINNLLLEYGLGQDGDEGDLVFTSRLVELIADPEERKTVADKMEKILEEFSGKIRPQPYYALLAADGDNMGAAIDHLTTQPDPQSQQRKLSVALSAFADAVEGIVKTHEGVLVYAGGDDVLAYLPLHTVLQCANELANEFATTLSSFKTEKGISPTLSTGIVVTHHLEPLSDALEMARRAEQAAKALNGKHGLAITVSKRSGVDRTIQGNRIALNARIQKMITWRRNGSISAGTAYELQNLDRVLSQPDVPKEAVIAEALRIIGRKRETGGNTPVNDEIKKDFREWMTNEGIESHNIKLREIVFELIIADAFAKALDMAEGKLQGE